jgi:ubiquinone/menaquinone biosynthesis methyltransferases
MGLNRIRSISFHVGGVIMSHTNSDINGMFTSIAHQYDRLNTLLTLNIDQLWRKKAVKLCHLKAHDRVLDLCCGTGKMMELECIQVGKDTKVVGLDFNKAMLQVGKVRLNKLIGSYKFDLIQGDAMALPFEDDTFDCVTIAFGLRNLSDKGKAIAEMYRVLKPGGQLVCLELSKPDLPVFKNLYNLYFNYALPVIGYLGTRDKKAYNYLRDSVNGFMTKKQLRYKIRTAGFMHSDFLSLSLGIASIHYGRKE